MHLIDIDVIGAQPPQRVGRSAQDPVSAGIAKDLSVLPLEPRFRSNHDTRAQPPVSNRAADDFFGVAKSIGGRRVD